MRVDRVEMREGDLGRRGVRDDEPVRAEVVAVHLPAVVANDQEHGPAERHQASLADSANKQ